MPTKTKTPAKEKKPSKSKLTVEENKQIADCIDSFKIVNEGISALFMRPNERKAARRLILKYNGYSELDPLKTKLQLMIEFLPKYNHSLKNKNGKIPYGTVRKPSELEYFLADIVTYKRKHDSEIQYQKHQAKVAKIERENYEKQKLINAQMSEEDKKALKEKHDAFKKKLRGF